MNRKILALNLGLLALLGTLGWMLRAHWMEARARHLATLAKNPKGTVLLAPPSPAPPEPAVAGSYLEVAQKMLFSKDRNPNVIIEPPPPPPPKPPEEPPPPRPEYYGQMGLFGEPVVLLGVEKGGQKGFRPGDKVGPFTLVAFTNETITLEWKGKTLEYRLADLKPKDAVTAQAPAPRVAAKPASSSSVIGGSDDKAAAAAPELGAQVGETRTCVPGDNSPSGTVKNGYRKSSFTGPFGPVCSWEPIR